MEKYVDCHNCQNQYDCERTYLGGCTNGQEWAQREERNLTDEEIVNDIERSTSMPSYWKKIVLDLIHRLKDENERLSLIAGIVNKGVAVEIVNMQETIDKQKAEIERLKLDLKHEKNWCKIQTKQAIKDTAKEIANWLVTTESNKEDLAKIIKEHYNVEVE